MTGCATTQPQTEVTTYQALIALTETIEHTADATLVAYKQGKITKKQACKVHQYGKLALSILKEAEKALDAGEEDTAVSYINMAREALIGFSAEAQRLVDDHCGGN